jgi:aminopeptidase N
MLSIRLISRLCTGLIACWCSVLALPGEFNDHRLNYYDAEHYDLTISFNFAKKTFNGILGLRAKSLTMMNELALSATNRTLTIDSVFLGPLKVPFIHSNDHIIINLPENVLEGKEFEAKVYYHGISDFTGEFESGGVFFSASDRVATSSEPNFARRWFPCKDMPSDKATASVTIIVPDSLTAVSNGILKNIEKSSGMAAYHWATEYPTATYLIFAAAAVYKQYSEVYDGPDGNNLKIYYYLFPEDYEKGKIDFQNTKEIIDFFTTIFGEYPFIKEKFGFAEVDGELTMENQTLCTIQQNMFTGDRQYELTLAHEAAHQWFGDMITPLDWHHTWLNEGFATYAGALYLEHRKGREAYQKYIGNMMSMEPGYYAGSVVGKSDTSFWDSFAPRVYYKGAIVLHMLRGMMGDSVFFRCLLDYINNPHLRYANAKTDDFIHECESFYGRDLGWFFNQWIYADKDSIDRPDLVYNWNVTPRGSLFDVEIKIEQTTAPAMIYRLPFDITLVSSSGERVLSVVDSLAAQIFSFELSDKPDLVIIDKQKRQFLEIHKREPASIKKEDMR